MAQYQGYWATERAMSPKAFCQRMGEATCRRVDLAPDSIWEVTCLSAGYLYIATDSSAPRAWRRVAEQIHQATR